MSFGADSYVHVCLKPRKFWMMGRRKYSTDGFFNMFVSFYFFYGA